jgi:D-arabinose 1-dehydrogenase-like Zn-dependent alcohol dehydrogenase
MSLNSISSLTKYRFEVFPYPYPQILGFSYAGIIEAVGPNALNFKVGDRVAIRRPGEKFGDPKYGAFQQYALAHQDATSLLSPETSLKDGASVMTNLAAVCSALTVFMGLDRPTLTGTAAERKGKKILVYGGSSSAGGLAIRYATAGGYEVVTTSSPKNYDYVASLSPVTIVDHTQPAESVVENLRAHGPYYAIFDPIGVPAATNILVDYLSSIGGGEYHTLLPLMGSEKPIPDNVERKFESYSAVLNEPEHEELGRWFQDELVPKGLSNGVIIATPPQWVKGGLEKAQHALDLLYEGKVSAKKLVLDPWE